MMKNNIQSMCSIRTIWQKQFFSILREKVTKHTIMITVNFNVVHTQQRLVLSSLVKKSKWN